MDAAQLLSHYLSAAEFDCPPDSIVSSVTMAYANLLVTSVMAIMTVVTNLMRQTAAVGI